MLVDNLVSGRWLDNRSVGVVTETDLARRALLEAQRAPEKHIFAGC